MNFIHVAEILNGSKLVLFFIRFGYFLFQKKIGLIEKTKETHTRNYKTYSFGGKSFEWFKIYLLNKNIVLFDMYMLWCLAFVSIHALKIRRIINTHFTMLWLHFQGIQQLAWILLIVL